METWSPFDKFMVVFNEDPVLRAAHVRYKHPFSKRSINGRLGSPSERQLDFRLQYQFDASEQSEYKRVAREIKTYLTNGLEFQIEYIIPDDDEEGNYIDSRLITIQFGYRIIEPNVP